MPVCGRYSFIDTLNRPGKTEIFVTDTAKFVDLSTMFSGNNKFLFRQVWNFGQDGAQFVRQGPSPDTVKFAYAKQGPYEATVTLVDTLSSVPVFTCSNKYSKKFNIIFPVIPNIITPDGDNKNDYFDFVRRMPGYAIHVYNRWGREVYKTDSYANDFSAPNLDNGFYFYNMKSSKGGPEFKGWLQVVNKNK